MVSYKHIKRKGQHPGAGMVENMTNQELEKILDGMSAKDFIKKNIEESKRPVGFERRPEGACKDFLRKYFAKKSLQGFEPLQAYLKYKKWESCLLNAQKVNAQVDEGAGHDVFMSICFRGEPSEYMELPEYNLTKKETSLAAEYAKLVNDQADFNNIMSHM